MDRSVKFRVNGVAEQFEFVENLFSFPAATAQAEPVALGNPRRYAIGFSLLQPGTQDRVSTDSEVGILQGLGLQVFVPQWLTIKDMGPLPFAAWYFSNNGPAAILSVFEIIQLP